MPRPDQKVEELNSDDVARVEAQRKWVREHYKPESEHEYATVEGKLRLLQTILDSGWIEPSETVRLQCLGTTLGDALAQHLGMRWVAVEDQSGRDPALLLDGTTILIFPITMISKRIERGEDVDVHEIFHGISGKVDEIKREIAESGRRE